MPAYSEEKQKEHMERVREILAIYPRAGVYKIRSILQSDQKSPLFLDPVYILKLKKKIEAERSRRFDKEKVEKYIAKLEDEIEEVVKRAWLILASRETRESEKIMAAKLIIDSKLKLLEAKMNAGIFERNLGTINFNSKITEERKIAILHAFKNWGIIKGDIPQLIESPKQNANNEEK
jgi:hypothetical protein